MADVEDGLRIVMITMDRETSSVILVRSDGKEARVPGVAPFDSTSQLSSLSTTPSYDGLVAITQRGDVVFFEMPSADCRDQLNGRLVVYLDQKDWSAVAKARFFPSQVSESDRRHAERLAEWVDDHRIVLPMSSGHFFETTRWFDNEARYALALSILQLSRGWQMRDALKIRRDELYDNFRRRFAAELGVPRNLPAFTLAPNALYYAGRSHVFPTVSPDLPPDIAFGVEALTAASTTIDVMLGTEAIEPGAGGRWVAATQEFSDWLDSTPLDAQQKRRAINAFLLADLGHEIPEESLAAGLTAEQMRQWNLSYSTRDITQLPAIGLYREVLYAKHLNPGTTWRPNDLTDMVYLSCATAYADFVVCERHMRGVLDQGLRKLGRPRMVFARLRDAIPAIEVALDRGVEQSKS